MSDKIIAHMIFEIMGRPAEHVKETLNNLVVKLGSEQGVNITNKQEHEPKKVDKNSDLYTTFAEIELEIDHLKRFFDLIFTYFPANAEIISPRNLKLRNEDLNELGNQLIGRLHQYDSITKSVMAERTALLNKLKGSGVNLEELFEGLRKEVEKPEKSKNKTKKS